MLTLKFIEIELEVKNVFIENIGILGIFILKSLKDRLSIRDISEITKFDIELLNKEIEILQKRGYLDNKRLSKRGLEVIKVYNFIDNLNNTSIVIDPYLEEFYFIKKEVLEKKAFYQIYPQRLFDYGILKKINQNKSKILSKFNTQKLEINAEDFELKYKFKNLYFKNFDNVILGGKFPIGEKVLKISYEIKNLKNEKVDIFKDFYFSLFLGKNYKNIKEYKGRVILPELYNINDIKCEGKVDFDKICLLNVSVNVEEKINKNFINLEEMIKGISEEY